MSRRIVSSVLLAAVAALALAPGAGARDGAGGEIARASVINGKQIPISRLPWMAHISYHGPVDKFGCTGTIVAPRLVLTAGHCLISDTGKVLSAANFKVTTASSEPRAGGEVSEVTEVLAYPGYQADRYRNDAGLLVLSAPVRVPALTIASPGDRALLAAGAQLLIAGWGGADLGPGPGIACAALRRGRRAVPGLLPEEGQVVQPLLQQQRTVLRDRP